MELKTNTMKLAQMGGWLSIIINTILFVFKLWIGIITKSIAITADAWHTLSDSLTSIIVLVGLKTSTKPADTDHPFGHGRIEIIASLIVGIILSTVGFNFLTSSIKKLFSQHSANYNSAAIIISIITIILKEGVARYSFWIGKKANLKSMVADAWHHRSDAFTSLLILIGIYIGNFFWWVDAVLGIIVSILIMYCSYDILRESINPLIGEKADDSIIKTINGIAKRIIKTSVYIHHFHLHKYGNHMELSFHIRLDKKLSLEKAHTITTKLEKAIRNKLNIEATIHYEPK